MEKKFGIKVISNSCGVLPHTLRVWEQRYQVFTPERTEKGQRLYTEADLQKAKYLVQLIDKGHTISALAKYSLSELESMCELFYDSESTAEEDRLVSISNKNLLRYLSEYKIELVSTELQHLRLSMGAKQFIFEIILPTMREMGEFVAKGKYTITQEHIISTIIRDQLSQIYLPNVGAREQEMILATPEGNLHELAIVIADILCRSARISTRFLGANHPAACLGEAINALRAPYLLLGVTSSDKWNYQEQIVDYLTKVDAELKRYIEVYLGGATEIKFPKFRNIKSIHVIPSFEDFSKILEDLP